MPVNKYSVLIGTPREGRVSGPQGSPPHYLIPVQALGKSFEVAVNIESDDKSQVLYFINEKFVPPSAATLTGLPPGLTLITEQGDPAVDFIRSVANGERLVQQSEMELLPLPSQTNSGNLKNAVIELLSEATRDPNGQIYAFGSQYTDGTGIHDVHMNQGNRKGDHDNENGIWQDGALLFYVPASQHWTAIFIAFQQQSWQTDGTGYPLS